MRPYQWVPLCVLALTACAPSDNTLFELGRNQQIQNDAPVKASSDMLIHAPVDRVWSLLANAQNWPRWQHDVTQVSIEGPLRQDVSFAWQAGDASIHSHVVLFMPDKALAWTGSASIAKALHVWTLTSVGPDTTRVVCRESMDGFLLARFYSSAELQTSIDHWMNNLKVAAESNASISR